MALKLDLLLRGVGVDLVRGAQLVVPDDLGVGDALPARHAEEVLRVDAWVAEEVVVGHHGQELGLRHGFPAWLSDLGVVALEGGCEDGLETGPVLEGRLARVHWLLTGYFGSFPRLKMRGNG